MLQLKLIVYAIFTDMRVVGKKIQLHTNNISAVSSSEIHDLAHLGDRLIL